MRLRSMALVTLAVLAVVLGATAAYAAAVVSDEELYTLRGGCGCTWQYREWICPYDLTDMCDGDICVPGTLDCNPSVIKESVSRCESDTGGDGKNNETKGCGTTLPCECIRQYLELFQCRSQLLNPARAGSYLQCLKCTKQGDEQ